MNDSAMHTRPDAWQESTESQSKEKEVRKYLRCLVFLSTLPSMAHRALAFFQLLFAKIGSELLFLCHGVQLQTSADKLPKSYGAR